MDNQIPAISDLISKDIKEGKTLNKEKIAEFEKARMLSEMQERRNAYRMRKGLEDMNDMNKELMNAEISSLMEIVDKGKELGKSPYESLKEAGYIKNPMDEFF